MRGNNDNREESMKKWPIVLIPLFLTLLSTWSEPIPLDQAITRSVSSLSETLKKDTIVAVLNCQAPTSRLADYVLTESVFALVNQRKFVVVERADIQLVKDELDFQLSGDVSDESAQSIGQMLGAEVIVSCAIDDRNLLRMKAIEVSTARLVAVSSEEVLPSGTYESLSRKLVLVADCVPNGADGSLAKAVGSVLLSSVSGAEGFRAVSGESRTKALGEQGVSLTDLSNKATRSRIVKLTEADAILLSTISQQGGVWFLSINLVNVATGTILSGSTESYRSAGTALEGASGQTLRCLGVGGPKDDRRVVTVKNVTELMQAIGTDRVIKLAPGVYDISKGYDVKNRSVAWVDEYDGLCPVIKSVSNISIMADGDASILISPKYGWVFSFETCSDISLSGITFGHTEPGYCLGGVLRFVNCERVAIADCELFGCGTYGLGIERTNGLAMDRCLVRDCTYGLAEISRSGDLTFTDTTFTSTGEFDLLSIRDSDHVTFANCVFSENWGSALFTVDVDCRNIQMTDCSFVRNETKRFCDGVERVSITRATFEGNGFPAP